MRKGTYVGFDVGATTMRVARVSEEGISPPRKVATQSDVEDGVRVLAQLIRECAGDEPLLAVAGGVPAIVSLGRIYRVPNKEGWTNFDLRGLGEAIYGAGVGKRVVAYIGVGTGVGTPRIVDGHIDKGAFDFEAGHQIVDFGSGKSLEELISGGAFEKRFGLHPREVPRAEYDHATSILAAGIYNSILHWSPEIVILGGSMMNEESAYRLADVVDALNKLPQIYPTLPEIKLAALKDDAGLHGARALLFEP